MRHSTILSRMSKNRLVDRSPCRLTKLPYSWVECVCLVYLFMVLKVPSAVREQRRLYLQRFLGNSAYGAEAVNIVALFKLLILFSRLVPPQTPEAVDPLVKAHLEKEFSKLQSKNKLTVESLHGGKPWVADHRHWNYQAAKRATKVFHLRSSFDI